MARWIYNNPPETTPESEQRTARLLDNLGDDFTVRWGFYYTSKKNGIFREGDFVVQGPGGHILVMEVKGGQPSCDPHTGEWSMGDGRNPFRQLDAECAGVVDRIAAKADEFDVGAPFVDKVLALPDVELAGDADQYEGVPRARFAAAGDLRGFELWWDRRFAGRRRDCSDEEARRVFEAVFAIGLPATANRRTLDFADRIIEQQTVCTYELLDALAENQQLLFNGGPGTGKTWLAIEQAVRLTREGARVLFLCYNLQLEHWLKEVCRKLSRDIYVFSYQSLGAVLLNRPHPPAHGSREEETRYFEHTLPEALWARVSAPEFTPFFDALVVDEAQDHNTSPEIKEGAGPGWWSVYFALLRGGRDAPASIFYDCEQRFVRRAGAFEPDAIRSVLQNPVGVVVRTPVRFTRQLRRYFRSLICSHTAGLLRDMQDSRMILPQGPEPQLFSNVEEAKEGELCARVIRDWLDGCAARPHEILLLHAGSKAPDWLWKENESGVRFYAGDPSGQPGDAVLAVSVNRAKGLDRRAVVVTGLPAWEEAAGDEYQAKTFVQGVTRARQLLAVVTRGGRGGG